MDGLVGSPNVAVRREFAKTRGTRVDHKILYVRRINTISRLKKTQSIHSRSR